MESEQTNTNTQTKNSSKMSFVKQFHFTPKQRRIWVALLAITTTVVVLGGAYGFGYNEGYDKAKKLRANPLSSIPMAPIFNSTTGTINEITDSTLVVQPSKGDARTIKIDDQTKITKKTDTLDKDALKKDMRVTVFQRSDQTATRIVVRD